MIILICIVNFKEIKDTIVFYLQMMLKEIETRAPGHEKLYVRFNGNSYCSFWTPDEFLNNSYSANKKAISHLLDSVRRYLDQNCEEDITLEQLARNFLMSINIIIHAFTDEYGISQSIILCRHVSKKAEKLLATAVILCL